MNEPSMTEQGVNPYSDWRSDVRLGAHSGRKSDLA
jgi:hypothetical protein